MEGIWKPPRLSKCLSFKIFCEPIISYFSFTPYSFPPSIPPSLTYIELIWVLVIFIPGLLWRFSRYRICLQCRRFNSWVRKIPWRRTSQPPPLFLPEKFHGQRSLGGYSPKGRKDSDTARHTDHQQSSFLGPPYLPGQLPRVFLWGKSQDSSNTFCLSCTVYVCVCVGAGPWALGQSLWASVPFCLQWLWGEVASRCCHLGPLRAEGRDEDPGPWEQYLDNWQEQSLWCVHGQSAQMVMPRGAHRTQESSLEGWGAAGAEGIGVGHSSLFVFAFWLF